MRLSPAELIKEFVTLRKEEYPGCDFRQMREAIKFQWRFLKHTMAQEELESVRLKGFGLFETYIRMTEKNKTLSEKDKANILRILKTRRYGKDDIGKGLAGDEKR